MEILDIKQGSKEWLSARLNHCTASEAPAMMGVSPYMSRNQLLDLKKGWITRPDSEFKKALFQRGHKNEENARPLAEERLFEVLQPVVGQSIVQGMKLLASFDGIGESNVPWENKTPNETILTNVLNEFVEDKHIWQLEHQALVSGSKFVLFSASDGESKNTAFLTYVSKPGRIIALIAGWIQFLIDLENHVIKAKREPVFFTEKEILPAIMVKVTGTDVVSNVVGFLEKIHKLAKKEVGKPLECDQDFADKENLIKTVGKVEIEVNKQIEQIQDGQIQIADFVRVAKEAAALLRTIRLDGGKAIKIEKKRKKDEIIADAKKKIDEFNFRFNLQLSPHSTVRDFIVCKINFDEISKGKRNLVNIKDAVDSAIANWLAEANQTMTRIVSNIKIIHDNDDGLEFLFNDWRSWVSGEPEAVLATTKARVNHQQEKERKRLDVERERIRIDEEYKAKAKVEREHQLVFSVAKKREIAKQKELAEVDAKKSQENKGSHSVVKEYKNSYRSEFLNDETLIIPSSPKPKPEKNKNVVKYQPTKEMIDVGMSLLSWVGPDTDSKVTRDDVIELFCKMYAAAPDMLTVKT